MKLHELLNGVEVLHIQANMDMDIPAVAYDSRKVMEGSMFVAIAGTVSDGNRFIPMAMRNGASVIVTAAKPAEDIPYVLVRSDRLALAQIAANFYGHPAKSMKCIGITGTNGKTSATMLLKHVLETVLGAKVGLIGTMYNMIGSDAVESERTTPESLDLQALFAKMRDAGCSYVVMEVSSHAIALDRVGGMRFDVTAVTNVTEDHLDFHHTMENYCNTKAELLKRCDHAVINIDDEWAGKMRAAASCDVVSTSAQREADLYAHDIAYFSNGVSFTAVYKGNAASVHLPIPGKFTVYNALTVLAIAQQLGITLQASAEALQSAKGVKGRVEVVPTAAQPYTILIDYAHTPDGMENVLSSVRGFCTGRLIAVFGCGGDRDPIKRPIMGKISTELADIAVITSDNPRTEEPMAIISDIVKGVGLDKNNYIVIENRPSAIRYAMDIAEKNDIIILLGKGHETYQEICGVKHHLDEREVVAAYLTEKRE